MDWGTTFVREMLALGIAKGDVAGALSVAVGRGPRYAPVVESLKAAVAATGTWDVPLRTPAALDFSAALRPRTILGKLTGLRKAIARTRQIHTNAGSTAFWAGEGSPRPISKMDFSGEVLEPLSVIAMSIVTRELLQSTHPDAEATLSRDLLGAAVAAADAAFVDPANSGTPGVKPASISHGVTPIQSTGESLEAIDADLGQAIDQLSDSGSDLAFATWILHPRSATYLARRRGSGGAAAFPGMGARGGVLVGLPAIVSAHVPVEAGSPGFANTSIMLLDPAQVLVLDDGAATFEASEKTTVEMVDNPSAGPAVQVSLWQTESIALKTVRYVNWKRLRPGMAQIITGVGF